MNTIKKALRLILALALLVTLVMGGLSVLKVSITFTIGGIPATLSFDFAQAGAPLQLVCDGGSGNSCGGGPG